MTTEDDFHAALDAHPQDYQTRLVFADWLQEQGDPRAEGYRALGALRFIPNRFAPDRFLWYSVADTTGIGPASDLPPDWYHRIEMKWDGVGRDKKRFPTRRAAEDAAALAFAGLPAARRAELLAS